MSQHISFKMRKYLVIGLKNILANFLSILLLGILIISFAGCTDGKLPDYVNLNGLRLIGIFADKPEAHSGDSVTVSPVIADVGGAGPITFQYRFCADPGVSYGAESNCNQTPAISQGSGTFTFDTVQDTAASDRVGLTQSFVLNIPNGDLYFQRRMANERYNGVPYILEFKIFSLDSSGVQTTIQAIKRVLVVDPALRSNLNVNPVLQSIHVNGTPSSSFNFTSVILSASLDSPESFSVVKADGQLDAREEKYLTTWFITDGKMKYFRTVGSETTEYDPGSTPGPARFAHLIAVTRDSRGGTSFKHIRAQ